MQLGNSGKRYSESFKLKVVEELERGDLSIREARQRYDIWGAGTLQEWLRKYGTGKKEFEQVMVRMASEEERIQELEKSLAKAHLKMDLMEAMLTEYNLEVPDIKKRLSFEALQEFEKNERKLQQGGLLNYAKR